MFSRHKPSFKIGVSKVQDFGNFELSPMEQTSSDEISQKGALAIRRIFSLVDMITKP